MNKKRALSLAREWAQGHICTLQDGEAGEYHAMFASILEKSTPNELLTLEQLRQMDGDPVYIPEIECWALVKREQFTLLLTFSDGKQCPASEWYEQVGPVFSRRRRENREQKIVKGPFLSNCLLEAAKAKIRHPVKTKITAVLHSEAGCTHFLWSDGQNDFDFGVDRRLVGPQVLLFRGYIRQHELGFNQEYKERMRQARSCPSEGEENT
jgi:hypothetical protein